MTKLHHIFNMKAPYPLFTYFMVPGFGIPLASGNSSACLREGHVCIF